VGQFDELRDGSSVVIGLLLENPLLALYAPTQVPSILRPLVQMSSRVSILHLAGLRRMDGCRSLTNQRLLKCQVIRAEDVVGVEVGQDEPVWPEGGSSVSEQ
jgi:hypothetical protein